MGFLLKLAVLALVIFVVVTFVLGCCSSMRAAIEQFYWWMSP